MNIPQCCGPLFKTINDGPSSKGEQELKSKLTAGGGKSAKAVNQTPIGTTSNLNVNWT